MFCLLRGNYQGINPFYCLLPAGSIFNRAKLIIPYSDPEISTKEIEFSRDRKKNSQILSYIWLILKTAKKSTKNHTSLAPKIKLLNLSLLQQQAPIRIDCNSKTDIGIYTFIFNTQLKNA
ncbi:MAG: hypothetical protein HC903_17515 [Methylacidiphilales bacterium]|nr:hypothetical protein [Candidatus Methylacidiphilales bacterium]NJR16826.1 hypothetical protein [Calothrix sp. CSU_2_0]